MPLFWGTFFLKRGELSVSFFRKRAELWVPLKKHSEIWALFKENVAKIAKKSKGYAKFV